MSPYITFRETDKNGDMQYYICQRDHPHYLGFISDHPLNKEITQVPITGHNLWVVFDGCLRGRFIPLSGDAFQEIEYIFAGMAKWFYENRVLKEPKKYKRFLIS